MIKNRELIDENDGKGTVRLVVQVDDSDAIKMAREIESNGGRAGSANSEWRSMGTIPQEMWAYDPWLIMAKKAARAGDEGEYNKYLEKFFEVHESYKTKVARKYWNGSRS